MTVWGTFYEGVNFDESVRSWRPPLNVMPAKAGIQEYPVVTDTLDPDFRRGDASGRRREKAIGGVFSGIFPEARRFCLQKG